MAEPAAPKQSTGGTQSGGAKPAQDDTNPLHDPAAAGADLYNSGNKTGNPVKSGTPGVGDDEDGVYATEKKTPMRDKQDTSGR